MSEPIDDGLDAAILAEPDAIEPRQVLADFLEEHGHPRATWIRMTLASSPDSEQRAFLARHTEALCGMPTAGFGLSWFAGFVDSVCIWRSKAAPLSTLTRVMARHRSYRFLRELVVLRPDYRFDSELPPSATLRVLKLPNAPELVASLVELPVFRTLKTLVIDRFVEETAQVLLAASPPAELELRTRAETIARNTRDALARMLPRWQGPSYARNHSTETPRYAAREFAQMPPVVAGPDGWMGSGVPIHEHPFGAFAGAWCYECASTNTVVIWAWVRDSSHGDFGRQQLIDYELHCRDCRRFSHYACNDW